MAKDLIADGAEEITGGEVYAVPRGVDGHDHGEFGIEFYAADGSFLGHAEIAPESIREGVGLVKEEIYGAEVDVADLASDTTAQVTNLCSITLASVVVLFALFGAVCALTFVRSLRVG